MYYLFKNKMLLWTFEILMIFGILYLGTKVSFLFEPIVIFASTLFFPVLIAGFFYFLLEPVVAFLERQGIKRGLGIAILFLGVIILITIGIAFIFPIIVGQIKDLVMQAPAIAEKTMEAIDKFSKSSYFQWMMNQDYVSFDQVKDYLIGFLGEIPQNISNSLSTIFSLVTNVALVIVTVPVLLFYMFKDGHKFPTAVSRFFPKKYQEDSLKIIKEMGDTVSSFIQGQMTVASFVGTLSFIGFLIIKLPYALVLALAVAITNIIPYVGPIIGAIPAVIVGLFISPFKMILVIVVILIAQQLEGNVISPLILGKTLNTHPVTIVILLLVAGNIAGILGMVLAVPVYAVTKVVVIHITKLIQLYRATRQ
ncbi:MAG: AI-2E family transporter [Bacillaceae bacterium]